MYKKNVSVVMGSVSGIGKAVVHELLRQEKVVVALDIDASGLEQLKLECKSSVHELITKVCDTTSAEQLKESLAWLAEQGHRIDEWVQSAGIARIDYFSEMPPDDFVLVQNVNFLGLVKANYQVLKVMEAQGFGKILNMGSVSGHVPSPLMTAYSASKHAVIGFTKSLQEELALTNSPVKLILVSPGFVETPLLTKDLKIGFPDFLRPALNTPEDVAKAVVRALETCPREAIPTLNGKFMMAAEKFPVGMPFRFLKQKLAKKMSQSAN